MKRSFAETNMGEALLLMEGIEKSFPGVHALSGCRFELRSGEVHALVGENGAGKSTLMKVLAGVYSKDAGRLRYKGAEVEIPSPRAAQQLGISMIHQELNLMPHLTVAQNIFIGREPRRALGFLDDGKLNDNARKLLETLRLDLDPRTRVSNLTVATQQMVEIAKALSFNSEILIMDEPTAALTETEIDDLFRIIRQLRDRGVGVVHISHRLEELKQISDRITVMRDGKYVDTVATREASIDQIIGMMVGRTIYETVREVPDKPSTEIALEAQGLRRGRTIKDVSFQLRRGEILGFAGLVGAGRTEVARAVFGADPREAGEIAVRRGPGWHRLSVGRPQTLWPGARDGRRDQPGPDRHEALPGPAGLGADLADPGERRPVREGAPDPHARPPAAGPQPVRRQPAEGGGRQMAHRRHQRAHLRRAHPRHRRGRQERDLPASQRPRQARQIHHHDLLGAAGAAPHE